MFALLVDLRLLVVRAVGVEDEEAAGVSQGQVVPTREQVVVDALYIETSSGVS